MTGVVTAVDGEIAMQTDAGEVVVGLGQAAYRQQMDFVLQVGDEVAVTGFYEEGEFKGGTVQDLTTGRTIILRDETGRPLWSGRGRQG
jgi:hypothetical protein